MAGTPSSYGRYTEHSTATTRVSTAPEDYDYMEERLMAQQTRIRQGQLSSEQQNDADIILNASIASARADTALQRDQLTG